MDYIVQKQSLALSQNAPLRATCAKPSSHALCCDSQQSGTPSPASQPTSKLPVKLTNRCPPPPPPPGICKSKAPHRLSCTRWVPCETTPRTTNNESAACSPNPGAEASAEQPSSRHTTQGWLNGKHSLSSWDPEASSSKEKLS